MHWSETESKEKAAGKRGASDDNSGGGASTDSTIRASEKVTKKTRASGERISGPQELAAVCQKFLAEKFEPTDKEKLREEFESLPENERRRRRPDHRRRI